MSLQTQALGTCEVCAHYGPALLCVNYCDCQNARCLFCLPKSITAVSEARQRALYTASFTCEDCSQGSLFAPDDEDDDGVPYATVLGSRNHAAAPRHRQEEEEEEDGADLLVTRSSPPGSPPVVYPSAAAAAAKPPSGAVPAADAPLAAVVREEGRAGGSSAPAAVAAPSPVEPAARAPPKLKTPPKQDKQQQQQQQRKQQQRKQQHRAKKPPQPQPSQQERQAPPPEARPALKPANAAAGAAVPPSKPRAAAATSAAVPTSRPGQAAAAAAVTAPRQAPNPQPRKQPPAAKAAPAEGPPLLPKQAGQKEGAARDVSPSHPRKKQKVEQPPAREGADLGTKKPGGKAPAANGTAARTAAAAPGRAGGDAARGGTPGGAKAAAAGGVAGDKGRAEERTHVRPRNGVTGGTGAAPAARRPAPPAGPGRAAGAGGAPGRVPGTEGQPGPPVATHAAPNSSKLGVKRQSSAVGAAAGVAAGGASRAAAAKKPRTAPPPERQPSSGAVAAAAAAQRAPPKPLFSVNGLLEHLTVTPQREGSDSDASEELDSFGNPLQRQRSLEQPALAPRAQALSYAAPSHPRGARAAFGSSAAAAPGSFKASGYFKVNYDPSCDPLTVQLTLHKTDLVFPKTSQKPLQALVDRLAASKEAPLEAVAMLRRTWEAELGAYSPIPSASVVFEEKLPFASTATTLPRIVKALTDNPKIVKVLKVNLGALHVHLGVAPPQVTNGEPALVLLEFGNKAEAAAAHAWNPSLAPRRGALRDSGGSGPHTAPALASAALGGASARGAETEVAAAAAGPGVGASVDGPHAAVAAAPPPAPVGGGFMAHEGSLFADAGYEDEPDYPVVDLGLGFTSLHAAAPPPAAAEAPSAAPAPTPAAASAAAPALHRQQQQQQQQRAPDSAAAAAALPPAGGSGLFGNWVAPAEESDMGLLGAALGGDGGAAGADAADATAGAGAVAVRSQVSIEVPRSMEMQDRGCTMEFNTPFGYGDGDEDNGDAGTAAALAEAAPSRSGAAAASAASPPTPTHQGLASTNAAHTAVPTAHQAAVLTQQAGAPPPLPAAPVACADAAPRTGSGVRPPASARALWAAGAVSSRPIDPRQRPRSATQQQHQQQHQQQQQQQHQQQHQQQQQQQLLPLVDELLAAPSFSAAMFVPPLTRLLEASGAADGQRGGGGSVGRGLLLAPMGFSERQLHKLEPLLEWARSAGFRVHPHLSDLPTGPGPAPALAPPRPPAPPPTPGLLVLLPRRRVVPLPSCASSEGAPRQDQRGLAVSFPIPCSEYLAAGAHFLTEDVDGGPASPSASPPAGGGGAAEAEAAPHVRHRGFLAACRAEGALGRAALRHVVYDSGVCVVADAVALRHVPAQTLAAMLRCLQAARAAHRLRLPPTELPAARQPQWALLLRPETVQGTPRQVQALLADRAWGDVVHSLAPREVSHSNRPDPPAGVRDAVKVMYLRQGTVRHVILLQPDPADVTDAADAANAAASFRACRHQRTVLGATPGALLQLLKLLSQPGGGGGGAGE